MDADYKFTCVDIGSYGSSCDGAIFKTSTLGQSFMNDELDIPGPKPLPNFPEGGQVPHCIVADEAFPLCVNLMRPFQEARDSDCQLMKGCSTTGSAVQGELWRMLLASWHKGSEYFKENYASNLTMWTK